MSCTEVDVNHKQYIVVYLSFSNSNVSAEKGFLNSALEIGYISNLAAQ